jgi:hypothetical protein
MKALRKIKEEQAPPNSWGKHMSFEEFQKALENYTKAFEKIAFDDLLEQVKDNMTKLKDAWKKNPNGNRDCFHYNWKPIKQEIVYTQHTTPAELEKHVIRDIFPYDSSGVNYWTSGSSCGGYAQQEGSSASPLSASSVPKAFEAYHESP